MQLQWAAQQFPSQHVEAAYQASRAPLLLKIDAWHLLLGTFCGLVWLVLQLKQWAVFSGCTSEQDSSPFVELHLPGLQASISACVLSKCCAAATASVCTASLLSLLGLRLRPSSYMRHRARIIAATWMLELCQHALLHLTHCTLQLARLHCHQAILLKSLAAPLFVMWQLPASSAALYCSASVAVRSLLTYATGGDTSPVVLQLRILQFVEIAAPVAVLYWFESRSRTAFLQLQGRAAAGSSAQQLASDSSSDETPKSIEQEHAEGPETPDHLREISSRPTPVRRRPTVAVAAGPASTSAASAAAGATAAGTGSGTAGSVAGSAAAVQAVQAPAQDTAAAAALLAYQSPFRRRTVTVKVQAPEDGSDSIDPAIRLAAAVQAAIAATPGGQNAAIASHVCIPGCLLFFGRVLLLGKQDEQQDVQPPAASQDGVWAVQLSSSSTAASGCGSGSVSNISRNPGRVSNPPAPGATAAAAPAASLIYHTMNDLEAAARDGSFQAGIQTMLQDSTAACPASHVVATWGSTLQLALWQQEHGLRQSWWSRRQQAAPAGSSASSNGRSLHIRAVLSQGSKVLLDMQQLLAAQQPTAAAAAAAAAPGRQFWSLGIDLPASNSSGNSGNSSTGAANSSTAAAVDVGGSIRGVGARGILTLYILPADSASTGGACAPLGDVTLLLLPHEAAAELTGLVKQHQFTQQQLQPLMMDMGVALEAESMLVGGNSNAPAYDAVAEGSSMADEMTPDYLLAAAEAADRVMLFLENTGLASCAEIVAMCQRQLLTACASQATSR